MTIAERIRQRREELNLTQEELAKKVGYKSRASINKVELGKAGVSSEMLTKLAKALHTTETYLIGIEDGGADFTFAGYAYTFSKDDVEMIKKYGRASEADKKVIDLILSKYDL